MGIILQATELIYTIMEIIMMMMILLGAANSASLTLDNLEPTSSNKDAEPQDISHGNDPVQGLSVAHHVSASSQFTPTVVGASPSQPVYVQSLSSVPVVGHPTSPVLFSLPVYGSSSFYNHKQVNSPTLSADGLASNAYSAYTQLLLNSPSLRADGLPNSDNTESRGSLIEICGFFFAQCFQNQNELGCSLFRKFCVS